MEATNASEYASNANHSNRCDAKQIQQQHQRKTISTVMRR